MRRASLLSAIVLSASAGSPRVEAAPLHATNQAATIISGIVFDSLAMRGLGGATVQITDARGQAWTRTAEADGAGRFEFTDVPIGAYLLGFFHAKLDSLSLGSRTLRVDVRTEQPMQVRLAIPSARTIARSVCGPNAVSDSTGLLMGYLRGADNSMPRANGTLSLRWAEIIIEKNSLRRHVPTTEASSGAAGLYAVCGAPVGTPLMLQAASATDSSGSFEVTIPASGFLHRDVFVAPLARTTVTVSDSAPPVEMLRGTGRLRGQVVGSNGRPVPGARVMMWGTGIETTSDADGRFALGALPGGTHTLEVRAVGFSPVQQAVDIVHGAPGSAEVELTNLGITLDTVRVSAQRVFTSRREADFERRLRSGHGHLIDENEIEKRRPLELTDLLRTVPGVHVLPGRRSGYDVYMRGGQAILGSGLCRADLMIDGARIANDENFPINSMIGVDEIRAVEVYAHATLVPVEYQSLSGCGVIAVWTGARRRK